MGLIAAEGASVQMPGEVGAGAETGAGGGGGTGGWAARGADRAREKVRAEAKGKDRSGVFDNYVTPDLTVCALGFLDSDEMLIHPDDVELVAEVVPSTAGQQEVIDRLGRYAACRVRALLLVDPGEGVWALYTEPGGTAYHRTVHGEYGEEIPLPGPLGFPVATRRLPRYRCDSGTAATEASPGD
ncbi:Uma2 family endonuclease [Streptomyces sp. 8N706]|uniref:Uma2 family endonuclease n=1 Tax=Streptomyces sp. 8N706 TaxID=3457416 RepID=UPI003FD50653